MSQQLTIDERATNADTLAHIMRVRDLLSGFIQELLYRGSVHDQSKLEPPEVRLFTEYTPKLNAVTYGSPEYQSFLQLLKPALDHHYANNRHHPEHFPEVDDMEVAVLEPLVVDSENKLGKDSPITLYLTQQLKVAKSPVGNMTLIDLLEMIADWKAASERHNDGNIRKSIEHNAGRFALGRQLERVFENTAREHI